MQIIKKYHSLALFFLYVLSVSFVKAPNAFHIVSLTLLFGYILTSFFFQYKDLPDIRKETDDRINELKKHYEAELKKTQIEYATTVKTLETEMKQVKSSLSAKSVGMSNQTLRF